MKEVFHLILIGLAFVVFMFIVSAIITGLIMVLIGNILWLKIALGSIISLGVLYLIGFVIKLGI